MVLMTIVLSRRISTVVLFLFLTLLILFEFLRCGSLQALEITNPLLRPEQTAQEIIFPDSKAYNEGYLKVSSIHSLWFAEYGNKSGIPVLVIHGGPGFGTGQSYMRHFDPSIYRIILYEQRGANRSRPAGELKENSTGLLIEDIEKLRKHLIISKWLIAGGSWGSTLSLLYGETYPERCLGFILRGIFLLYPSDYEQIWFGMRDTFPERWEKLNEILSIKERRNLILSYQMRFMNKDPNIHLPAARRFIEYDLSSSSLFYEPNSIESFLKDDSRVLSAVRIFTHYGSHHFFMKENQILDHISKIAHLPMTIIHGRYDTICKVKNAFDLHRMLSNSQLVIVSDGAHSAGEAGMAQALVTATSRMAEILKTKR